MNIFSMAGILIFITSSIMAGFMFIKFRESKNKLHVLWGLFCVSVAIWGGGGYKIATTTDIYLADAWWRVAHIGVIFIPILFTHFVYTFLNLKQKKFITALYALGIFFLMTNFIGNLFIANMRWVFNQFYYDSPPGIFYIPFTIMFFGLVIYSHIKLWLAYRRAVGVPRAQIKYFLWGTIVGFVGGSLSFLPVYRIDFYPVLNLFVCLYPIIIAYAITRYRLMDIRVGVRKGFIYVSLSAFAYAVFYTVAHSFRAIFGDVFAAQGYIVGIFIALAFTALFFLVQKNSQKFVNKYLYANIYNTQKTLEDLADGLHNLIKLDEIINSIVNTIMNVLDINRVGVLLRDFDSKKYKTAKTIGFNKKNGISRVRDNFLTRQLKETGEPLIFEELELIMRDIKPQTQKNIEKVRDNMKHIEADCCLPLLVRGELIGIIVLGSKKNGEAYSEQDISLLKSAAAQASIAISNAQLYNEMEKIVKSQTKELETKNQDLKETLEAKNNFLTIASHQLRTPTSVIKTSLQMMVDGTLAGEKKEDFIKRSLVQANRLADTIHDLLSSTAIEGKGFELNKSLTNIDELIAKMVKERAMKLEQKNREKQQNVELIYQQPTMSTPLLNIDFNKIEEVVANLIDNAIQYTLQGKIEIITETNDKNFIFSIKDTGIGIEKENLHKLFKKIARLPNAIQVCPNGTGLGLFIIKSMVEKHGGKVEVKSDGENKGSEFAFWLPIK